MSFLREVDVPDSFAPFVALREALGFVPKLFRAQTLLPRVVEAEAKIAGTVLLKDSELSRTQKECILLVIAAAKRNDYCVSAHAQSLRTLGMSESQLNRLVSDYQTADFTSADKALLDFALKLSVTPTLIDQQDVDDLRAQGFSDGQLLEAILMSALTNFLCSLSVGLGVEPDFARWRFTSAQATFTSKTQISRKNMDGAPSRPYLRFTDMSPSEFPPFAFFKQRFGFIPNIFRAQTLRPDVLEAEANAVGAILLTEDILSRFQKEGILLVISAANLNTYCVAVHCEMLRMLGVPAKEADQIAVDHHYTQLSNADKALLDFALKLATRPAEYRKDDIDLLQSNGFSEEQILEAVVMTSLTNFLNTLQMGLGTTPDFAPRLVFPLKEVNLSTVTARPMPEETLADESVSDDPDAEFVARVKAGDTDAFEELVRRHGRRVYRSLVGILGNIEEAEDALQDAFLKTFQHLPEFEGRARFSTWLVRIAINTGVQRLRGRKDFETLDDEEGFRPRRIQPWQENPEDSYSREELRRLVEQEVMKLPAKYRVALMLRDLEELSTEETANALGLSIPGVKARVLRGRLMLRESMAPYFTKASAGVKA